MTRLFAIFLFNTVIAIAGVEEYLRDIKPVLKERCYACHGALKQKAGLRVDSAENLRKGSKRGDVLALGQAGQGMPRVLTCVADYYERVGSLTTRLRGLAIYPMLILTLYMHLLEKNLVL